MDGPKLGKLIEDGDRRRDAIHIAVAPVTASESMEPGTRIGFTNVNNFEHVSPEHYDRPCVGIVDPFLTVAVRPGERFWMFLMPNTVTSLRHVWTHPAFTAAKEIPNG